MEIMQDVCRRLALLGYPRAGSPSESMLYPGTERYNLLEWLFQRLLGEKYPSPNQSTDTSKLADDSVRVKWLADVAKSLYITDTSDVKAIEGVGSYESRANFLAKVVELVEACQPEEGGGWSLDQQVWKYSQLAEILSERLPQVLSKECLMFTPEGAPSQTPLSSIPSVSALEEACQRRSETTAAVQEKLNQVARTYRGTAEDPRDANRQLHGQLDSFVKVAEEFKVVYEKEIRPWENSLERPNLVGIGPAANRLLTSYQSLSQLLQSIKNLHMNTAKCASPYMEQGPGGAQTVALLTTDKFVEALADVDRACKILETSSVLAARPKQ